MWICSEGFSVNVRFVILFGVNVKITNKGMQVGPTKIVTNVNFLNRDLVKG
jgi:hypothetical protein